MDVLRSTSGWWLGGALALALLASATARAAVGDKPPAIRAFKPVADTYVSAAEPRRNFGRTRSLRADATPEATVYLRFRSAAFGSGVESVTLLLHAETGTRGFQVRRVQTDAWHETRLTYRNAPRLSLRYASATPVRRGRWSAVDVTSLVEEDDGEVNLAITTRSPLGVVFASRESNDGPRLVVRTHRNGSEKPKPKIQARQPAP